jgi:hypothetical protein
MVASRLLHLGMFKVFVFAVGVGAAVVVDLLDVVFVLDVDDLAEQRLVVVDDI